MNGHPSRNAGSSNTVPLYDTAGLTSALTNPYAQHMSWQYYQACVQAYSIPRPRTTVDGYTLSSTYVQGIGSLTSRVPQIIPAPPLRDQSCVQVQSQPTVKPVRNHLTYGSWYQPGNNRCTRQGCPFTGSRKSVEVHMMDRHFILPPGWKKKDDWDADPSLRGKLITIQGTSLVLDTPEDVDAWIAERKRRFPTEERIQDKKRKLEEAVARGQLTPEDIGAGARKKHKQNATFVEGASKRFRGKCHERGRSRREESQTENVNDLTSQQAHTKTEYTRCSASIADDDETPEVVSFKVPTLSCIAGVDDKEVQIPLAQISCPRRIPQPKNPPQNLFALRSALLRNLLLPEIQVTVSNLSQTIRFLVENDFLRGAELRPGEAQEQMIEVLGSSENPCLAPLPPPEEPAATRCGSGLFGH